MVRERLIAITMATGFAVFLPAAMLPPAEQTHSSVKIWVSGAR